MTLRCNSKINSVTIDFRKLYSTWAYGCFVRCACPINNRTNKRNQPKHHHSGPRSSPQDPSPIYTKIELFKINFIRSITQHLIRRDLWYSSCSKWGIHGPGSDSPNLPTRHLKLTGRLQTGPKSPRSPRLRLDSSEKFGSYEESTDSGPQIGLLWVCSGTFS